MKVIITYYYPIIKNNYNVVLLQNCIRTYDIDMMKPNGATRICKELPESNYNYLMTLETASDSIIHMCLIQESEYFYHRVKEKFLNLMHYRRTKVNRKTAQIGIFPACWMLINASQAQEICQITSKVNPEKASHLVSLRKPQEGFKFAQLISQRKTSFQLYVLYFFRTKTFHMVI